MTVGILIGAMFVSFYVGRIQGAQATAEFFMEYLALVATQRPQIEPTITELVTGMSSHWRGP